MIKNLVIGLLAVTVIAESVFLLKDKSSQAIAAKSTGTVVQPTSKPSPRPPTSLSKGAKLADSPLSKMAYEIFPTDPAESKQALTGFEVKSKTLADGSTEVDLVPKDSDDQFQSYIIKKGETLYFMEMLPGDDKTDADKDINYRDDYGVVVDGNGVVL